MHRAEEGAGEKKSDYTQDSGRQRQLSFQGASPMLSSVVR